MSWDEPTQEELDDAIIEDTIHCHRCGSGWMVTEVYSFDLASGQRVVCPDCCQDEIDAQVEVLEAALAVCKGVVEMFGKECCSYKVGEMAKAVLARLPGGNP